MGQLWTQLELYAALKAQNTRSSYRAVVQQWCEFLRVAPNGSSRTEAAIRSAGAEKALRFIDSLKNARSLSDSTVWHRFNVLRGAYKHLVRTKLAKENPFDQITGCFPLRRRVQVRPTKLIPFHLVEEILSLPNVATKIGLRDSALLGCLFGGGLRRSEVRNLKVGDYCVSPTGCVFLAINGAKSGENQTQSIPDWVVERLVLLISQRKSDGASEGDPLFCGYFSDGRVKNIPLGDKTVYNVFLRYCTKVGIKKIGCHAARATAASYLKTQGWDDRDVQLFLRHKHPGMVQAYDKRVRGLEANPGKMLKFP